VDHNIVAKLIADLPFLFHSISKSISGNLLCSSLKSNFEFFFPIKAPKNLLKCLSIKFERCLLKRRGFIICFISSYRLSRCDHILTARKSTEKGKLLINMRRVY